VDSMQHNSEGVMSVEDIDELVADLGEPSLAHPLIELRTRYMRQHSRSQV
jgi:hypothetical protein